MSRRRKGLSEEDRQLWRKVAETATPLHPLRKDPAQQTAIPAKPDVRPVLDLSRLKEFSGSVRPPAQVRRTDPPKVAMDHRQHERLKRGKLNPEARIDLHGMTAERAHVALRGFILRCHGEGVRLALVITGKGRAGGSDSLVPDRVGVLRHAVPEWLRQAPLGPLILQIAPAHQRHGAGGAYYVYLRRRK